MLFAELNYWALGLSLVIWIALRVFWYSPVLFGKAWLEASNGEIRDGFSVAALLSSLPFAALALFVINVVIVWYDRAGGEATWLTGLAVGWTLWLGFPLPTYCLELVDRTRELSVSLIALGYFFVSYGVAGALIGAWH